VLWRLEARANWERDTIFSDIKAIADASEVKMKEFLAPFFVAVAGSTASFSIFDAMVLLGPDMTRARLRHAIEVLGGVSKKAAKRLEKAYQAL
jgi:glutamyl-tRNA synthetase